MIEVFDAFVAAWCSGLQVWLAAAVPPPPRGRIIGRQGNVVHVEFERRHGNR